MPQHAGGGATGPSAPQPAHRGPQRRASTLPSRRGPAREPPAGPKPARPRWSRRLMEDLRAAGSVSVASRRRPLPPHSAATRSEPRAGLPLSRLGAAASGASRCTLIADAPAEVPAPRRLGGFFSLFFFFFNSELAVVGLGREISRDAAGRLRGFASGAWYPVRGSCGRCWGLSRGPAGVSGGAGGVRRGPGLLFASARARGWAEGRRTALRASRRDWVRRTGGEPQSCFGGRVHPLWNLYFKSRCLKVRRERSCDVVGRRLLP